MCVTMTQCVCDRTLARTTVYASFLLCSAVLVHLRLQISLLAYVSVFVCVCVRVWVGKWVGGWEGKCVGEWVGGWVGG